MKLYLITQTDKTGYDTYDAAVVAANSAEEAANIDPGSGEKLTETKRYDSGTWTRDPSRVKVKELGVALADVSPGVICASFNAG